VLARQITMNVASWRALESNGVTTETELRLDFNYISASESSAQSLATLLREETDYEVRVEAGKSGGFKRRNWFVNGRTQPTQVSPEILDQWVTWMVTAGFQHGQCIFDGWGAMVPRKN
jgi:hypothetical protein